MRKLLLLLLCNLLLLSAWVVRAAEPAELSGKLLLFAAASTTEAVDQIRAEFTRMHPKVTIRTSFGSSATLAQQIRAGADADLFLSASVEWSEALAKDKLIDRQQNLLGNQLVIVVPADSELKIQKLADLLDAKVRHLALADPKSVPAGVYAKQALTKLDLWKQLEPKVAAAGDVRQALHFVDTGAAEAGIVYATDAATSKAVRVAARIELDLSEPIRYPLVLLKHGADNPAAVALYQFFTSPAASAIFRQRGFVVLTAP